MQCGVQSAIYCSFSSVWSGRAVYYVSRQTNWQWHGTLISSLYFLPIAGWREYFFSFRWLDAIHYIHTNSHKRYSNLYSHQSATWQKKKKKERKKRAQTDCQETAQLSIAAHEKLQEYECTNLTCLSLIQMLRPGRSSTDLRNWISSELVQPNIR